MKRIIISIIVAISIVVPIGITRASNISNTQPIRTGQYVYTDPIVTQPTSRNFKIDFKGSGATISIGSGTSTFASKTLFTAFDGEVQFSLNLPNLGSITQTAISGSGKNSVITAQNNNYLITYNPVPPKDGFNDLGGFDYSIQFKRKPGIIPSSISFNIADVTGVNFAFQPSLTSEYKIGDSLPNGKLIANVTDTAVVDSDNNTIVNRPDYVVNSIAIYAIGKNGDYTALGGKNYRAGKMGHLYRLKAVDATGAWAWLDWGVPNGSTLSLNDSTGFLKTATYPVTIQPAGDTFGYTTLGASTSGVYCSDSHVYGAAGGYSPGQAGTGTSMSIGGYGPGSPYAHTILMVYDTSSPSNLVGQTNAQQMSTTKAWNTANFVSNPSLSNATYYVVAFGDGYWWYRAGAWAYDSGGPNTRYSTVSVGYPTVPSTITWWSITTDHYYWSLYVTYTPSASAPTVTTSATTVLTDTTATGNGNITATGGENPNKRGVCYSSSNNPPTTSDSKVEESGSFGTGVFTESITGLSGGTTYYLRAYAINSGGTGYGSVDTFTTMVTYTNIQDSGGVDQSLIDVFLGIAKASIDTIMGITP